MFSHTTVDPSIAWEDAAENTCTIRVSRIAATEDTQGLKAAATTDIRENPNMAIGYAGSFSRRTAMKSHREEL